MTAVDDRAATGRGGSAEPPAPPAEGRQTAQEFADQGLGA